MKEVRDFLFGLKNLLIFLMGFRVSELSIAWAANNDPEIVEELIKLIMLIVSFAIVRTYVKKME